MNLLLLMHHGITKITEELSFFSADRLLVVIAILVSLLGLVISVRYNRETLEITKSHNKKITLPSLTLHREFLNNTFVFEISNSGFGPAILTKVEFYYEDEIFNSLEVLFIKIIPNYVKSTIYEKSLVTVFDNREVLAVGANQNVQKSAFNNEPAFNKLKEVLLKIEIKIDYESVYGQKLKLKSFIG